VELEIGKKRFHLGTRESMLIPRNMSTRGRPSAPQRSHQYLPTGGKIEDFFQALAKFKDLPTREQAIEKSYTAKQIDRLKRVFEAHGMIVTGPPLDVENGSN